MKHEEDHPCKRCTFFYGFEEVKTMDTLDRGFKMHVAIPICGHSGYIFALGRCDNFEPLKEVQP